MALNTERNPSLSYLSIYLKTDEAWEVISILQSKASYFLVMHLGQPTDLRIFSKAGVTWKHATFILIEYMRCKRGGSWGEKQEANPSVLINISNCPEILVI